MSDIELQSVYIIGPCINKIAVMPLTTTTSGLDLSLAAQLGPDVDGGRFLTLVADGDAVYFFMNNADSGTADPAATSGANRCFLLPNGGSLTFVPHALFHFVRARTASTTANLRMYISSKPPLG